MGAFTAMRVHHGATQGLCNAAFAVRDGRSFLVLPRFVLYYCGESNLISGSAKERLDLLREIIGAIGLVEQVHIIDR
jgi:hypothetical protein